LIVFVIYRNVNNDIPSTAPSTKGGQENY